MSAMGRALTDLTSRLTVREQQIVQLVAAGYSNAEIAARLGLRVQTVKNRLCDVYLKTGTRNRTALALTVLGRREK